MYNPHKLGVFCCEKNKIFALQMTFLYLYKKLVMFDIEKTYNFTDDTFNIRLKEMSKDERVEFLSLGLKYEYLNLPGHYFVVKVKSKSMGTDIVVLPEEVVPMLEDSIQQLILIEMYEHCQVLKDLKDTFNTYYSNDN